MAPWIRIFCLFVAWLPAAASTNPRLAIIPCDHSKAAGDLLTAAITASGVYDLVERAEIDKVMREMDLASWSGNLEAPLKAGKLLGAQGVLFIETRREAGQTLRLVRLSAVASGAMILVSTEPMAPKQNEAEWANLLSMKVCLYKARQRVVNATLTTRWRG